MLFFATTINYIDRAVLGILATDDTFKHTIGWSEAEYGYVTTVFQAAYAIGLLLVGYLMDRFGTRKGFSFAMVFWSLAAMAHSLAHSALTFGMARFALGLGEAGNFPAAIKTVAEWFPKKERALATGIFNSGSNVGAIAAPLVVPLIVKYYGYAVALSVFAYHAGGATAVGLLMLVRMLSSAVVAPFSSVLGDRHNRARVMISTDLIRAAALAGAGVAALAHAPAIAIYALAVLVAIVSTAFHPAQAALTPSLARTPEELTAANAVGSTIESVGTFAGPALGGLLLAATSIGVVFIVMAALFLWSAFFVLRIRTEAAPAPASGAEHPPFLHQATAGIRTIVKEPNVRVIVGLYGCQTLVAGALRVFIVVMAFRLLDTGNAGVGFLNSATGIGGLLGAFATIIIVGRSRLATDFGVGVVLWGLPIALIGIWPNEWLALIMLGVVGVANTIVDVAAFTLLQRAVPDEVLARVFGVLQSVLLGTIGIGSVLASGLVSVFGARTTLVVAGAFLPAVALLTYRRLVAIDRAATGPAPGASAPAPDKPHLRPAAAGHDRVAELAVDPGARGRRSDPLPAGGAR